MKFIALSSWKSTRNIVQQIYRYNLTILVVRIPSIFMSCKCIQYCCFVSSHSMPSLSSLRLLFLFYHYWRQTLLPPAVWQVVQPILTRPIQARTTVDLIAILSTQLHIIFSAHNHNVLRIRLVCRTCRRLKSVYRLSEGKSHFLQPLTGNIVAAARHALHISFQSFRSQYLRFASAVEVSYQKSFNVFGKRTNRNPKQNKTDKRTT